jgi:hypothetical protein
MSEKSPQELYDERLQRVRTRRTKVPIACRSSALTKSIPMLLGAFRSRKP